MDRRPCEWNWLGVGSVSCPDGGRCSTSACKRPRHPSWYCILTFPDFGETFQPIHLSMNNLFRGLIAGGAAYKLGGGCFGTILVFVVVYMLLGSC